MPRSPSPTSSLIGPSRSNSVARQHHEKKPYERPSNGNASNGSDNQNQIGQNGLLGGLKRSFSRWFSQGPVSSHSDSALSMSNGEERQKTNPTSTSISTSTSLDSAKRPPPQMSPERAGTPSKKQRVTSPRSQSQSRRFEVQGRAVESFNVQEYGSSRLPTQRGEHNRQRVPNYARPFGSASGIVEEGSSMSRSRTMGGLGGYNDPPGSMLAGSPATSRNVGRNSSPSISGMRRSETMTLHVDRDKERGSNNATRLSTSTRSPLYTSGSIPRSNTLGSLVAPANGRMASPFRGQQEAAERVARQRAMREGSLSLGGSPMRQSHSHSQGLRSSSRMEIEPSRTREPVSPTPRAESPRRSMSSMRDMSVVPPSPSRGATRSSRLRFSVRPPAYVDADDHEEQEYLMDAPEDDGMDIEADRDHARHRRGTSGRMSVDPAPQLSPMDSNPNVQAEALLQQLAEMRRSSRHPNIQAGRPSSVQTPPVPTSLSTRPMRKRLAVRVPKASTPAEEALRLSTTGSLTLSEGPARLKGTKRAKEFELEKAKGGSVMQRPYVRKPSGYSRPKSDDEDEGQNAEVERKEDDPDEMKDGDDVAIDKPFTFSMANAPTKVSGPMNIQFSPSATKIVRTGTSSTLRAQSAVTHRKHEPAASTARKIESRGNQFAVPDDDDDDDDDDEDEEEGDDGGMKDDGTSGARSRQPSQSPQPVSIPAPVRSPSPRKKKDVDVTAVRKARGFLDAAGVNRPRASSPLAAAPLNASALSKTTSAEVKPPLTLASSSLTHKTNTPVPDFFAMPKKPTEAPASTAGKGMGAIGLGRPSAPTSTPAPSFSFTAPSPTSSPNANPDPVRSEATKPPTPFSFAAQPSTTPTKPPPFSFSPAPTSADAAKPAVPSFFSKPAVASSEPKLADKAPPAAAASAAPPSFFSNIASPAPAPSPSSGFTFSAAKPLPGLFGSSQAAPTPPQESVASLPKAQDKPADTPAPSKFTFGASQPAPAAPAGSSGGLFGSQKSAETSTNPLFGGLKPAASSGSASPQPAASFDFGSSSKASTGFKFGAASGGATSTPPLNFAFGATAPKETASTPAPANLFGTTNNAASTTPAAPVPNPFAANTSKPSTPAPTVAGFTFGTAASAPSPAPSSPFNFGSVGDNKPAASSTPFTFGGANSAPASSPFGTSQPAVASAAPASNMFGSTAPASGGMFGSASIAPASGTSTPSFGGFGQASSTPAPAAASPFGRTSAATTSAPSTSGFGGFGAPAQPAPAPSAGMFGATSTGFGVSPAPQPGLFGSAPGTPGTPGTANAGFSFNAGAAGPADSRQGSPAFSVGAGDAPGGRKIRKLPGARKK